MPELPEVEAARRSVHNHCLGGTIVKASVDDDKKVLEGVSSSSLEESLTGKKIVSAHRKGKHLWLQLDSQPWPSFQFGMSGAILIKGVKGPQYKSSKVKDDEEFPTQYSKVHLQLDNGVEMAFTDKRRFARVRLLPDPMEGAPISELGLDAYNELPSEVEFSKGVQAKQASIKALLLDQSFLAGIGNWVADEVLFQAKIHPEHPANKLSDEDCKHLRITIKEIVTAMLDQVGFQDSDDDSNEVLETAVNVDADSEQFPKNWLFHHRWDKKPGTIDGNQIELITVKGRTSAYVPAIQKYSGPELKGAKKKAAVEEEIPHDDEDEPSSKKAKQSAEASEKQIKSQETSTDVKDTDAGKLGSPGPKRRGRPPKMKSDSPKQVDEGDDAIADEATPVGTKRRGRPPKPKSDTETPDLSGKTTLTKAGPVEGKRRGRPPKAKADSVSIHSKSPQNIEKKVEDEEDGDHSTAARASPTETKRRGRGRPPKAKSVSESKSLKEVDKDAEEFHTVAVRRGRGRPPKAKTNSVSEDLSGKTSEKEGKDTEGLNTSAVKNGSAQPKRRGRPPKVTTVTVSKDLDGEKSQRAGSGDKISTEKKGEGAEEGHTDAVKPVPAGTKKRGRPPKAKSSLAA